MNTKEVYFAMRGRYLILYGKYSDGTMFNIAALVVRNQAKLFNTVIYF